MSEFVGGTGSDNHLLQWCLGVIGEKEMDARFQAVGHYPGLHHFKKGIVEAIPIYVEELLLLLTCCVEGTS